VLFDQWFFVFFPGMADQIDFSRYKKSAYGEGEEAPSRRRMNDSA